MLVAARDRLQERGTDAFTRGNRTVFVRTMLTLAIDERKCHRGASTSLFALLPREIRHMIMVHACARWQPSSLGRLPASVLACAEFIFSHVDEIVMHVKKAALEKSVKLHVFSIANKSSSDNFKLVY